MDKPAEKRPIAWQPLTPKGVAAFAAAKQSRLWLIQLIFALIGGLALTWCLRHSFVPVISNAVKELPEKAEVRDATLKWGGDSPRPLSENQFLSVAVDLNHEGLARSPAHIQVELGEKSVKVLSLLGFVEFRYPSGWRIGLNRAEAQPWWGAWTVPILWMAGGATLLLLMVVWALLSGIYFAPAWLVAFFANRQTRPGGVWKICNAALLPGALVFSASIVLYGIGVLDIPELALLAGVHIVVGWVYLAAALLCLPERQEEIKQAENPFAAARAAQQASNNPFARRIGNENPFAADGGEKTSTP